MKHIILIFIITFFGFSQIDAQIENHSEYENLYSFKDNYINLDNYQIIYTDVLLSYTFKNISQYSSRFEIPLWFDSYIGEVVYNNKYFLINEDNSICITDLTTGEERTIENMERGIDLDNVSLNNFLISTSNGVLHIKRLEREYGYVIYKYDENGHILFYVYLEHTDIVVEGNSHYSHPYLSYLMHTDDYMVFTSYNRDYEITYLINLNNGEIKSFDFIANGVIRDEDERTIIGFVIFDEEDQSIKVNLITHEWTANMNNNFHDVAQTLIKDNILVIADYCNIATGSNLYAYDLNTGKFLWQADVEQLNVGHSEYYNTVILSLYENKVIMEGIEAYGRYLQVFDINDGSRLYISDDF